MKVVIFCHPDFLNSQSMPRFAKMIENGMRLSGNTVYIWTPKPFFYLLPISVRWKKWLGYVDQYFVFPIIVRWRLLKEPSSTFFVFVDQALGPWVPLIAERPHVVHVHDFMALRSALGEIPDNITGWTGQQYQAMIRRGFSKGKNFISVSENTKRDLARFLYNTPNRSDVVYNGLNFPYMRMEFGKAAELLNGVGFLVSDRGFMLHVGGNQWYKNRIGVLEIYKAYASQRSEPLPLVMIGEKPSLAMTAIAKGLGPSGSVTFLTGVSNDAVCAAYSCASLMVFPSLAEGFGWPIAEAMACGCVVLTTGDAPMTEVGGEAAFYIPPRMNTASSENWAQQAAAVVIQILNLPEEAVRERRAMCLQQASKFRSADAISAYERIYLDVIDSHPAKAGNGLH